MSCLKKYNEPTQTEAPVFRRVYTSYRRVNELLNEFHDELKLKGITFRVKGEEIGTCVFSDAQTVMLLREALSMAAEAVARCRGSSSHYIQVNNMIMQHKQFLKIVYSSESNQDVRDIHYQNMEQILLKKAGYIKLENGENENTLMIAIDTEKSKNRQKK
ncbi:MAG: hypothetical protein PHN80_06595 [Hespellia sp.]|nr:hypothetical protein [Hespellia sp.]